MPHAYLFSSVKTTKMFFFQIKTVKNADVSNVSRNWCFHIQVGMSSGLRNWFMSSKLYFGTQLYVFARNIMTRPPALQLAYFTLLPIEKTFTGQLSAWRLSSSHRLLQLMFSSCVLPHVSWFSHKQEIVFFHVSCHTFPLCLATVWGHKPESRTAFGLPCP